MLEKGKVWQNDVEIVPHTWVKERKMLGGMSNVLLSTYSQTVNGSGPQVTLVNLLGK